MPNKRRYLAPFRNMAFFATWLLAWTSSAGLAADTKVESDQLVVTGSSTIAPIIAEIAQRYEVAYPAVRIDVQSGGSTRGIIDLRRGLSDVAMVSRALMPAESQEFRSHTVASDGLAFIVHRDNPLRALSSDDVKRIFTGRVRDWEAFGIRAGKIVVISKAEGRATLDVFLEHFKLTTPELRPHVLVGENQHDIKMVSGTPEAIGYVAISTALYEVSQGAPIALVALDGITPSKTEVAAGRYPILRELNLLTTKQPSALAQDFIAFACSAKVRDILESFNVVAPDSP